MTTVQKNSAIQDPSMKHRVVSKDAQGVSRIAPASTQWQAEDEAKKRIARGHTDVEVQSWNKNAAAFLFNSVANNHLQEQDERVVVDEDLLEALGALAASQKSIYRDANSGKLTRENVMSFVNELGDLYAMLKPYVSTEADPTEEEDEEDEPVPAAASNN